MDMNEERSGTALLSQNLNDAKKALPTEEIVSSSPSHKSWKGIVIAILVILMISGLIILAIYLTSPGGVKAEYGDKMTFRDFFVIRSYQKFLNFEWVGNGKLSYVNASDERKLLNMNTKTETELIWKTYMEEVSGNSTEHQLLGIIMKKSAFPSSCKLSPDEKFLFIYYNHSANYRHSSTAQYTVFNVSHKETNVEIGPIPQAPLQNVEWSPVGHTLAFVYNNNIYYNENPLNNTQIVPVTTSLPQSPQITYGVADWLYEEEILKVSNALWWSPQGKNIAFLSFNDEMVDNYKIKVYGNQDDLNGYFIDVRYPKAGEVPRAKNPVTNAFIYSLSSKYIYNITIPPIIPKDYYICFAKWFDDDHLLIGWTNREQNEAWLTMTWLQGNINNHETWVIYHHQTSHGWINMLKQTSVEPIMFPKKKKIYIIESRITRTTELRNIAELTVSDKPGRMAVKKWIITADFDFTDILYFDGQSTMYFSGVLPNNSKELHLYKADINTGKFECRSCDNPNCTYNQFDFNPNGQYVVHSCLGPSVPTYYLLKVAKSGKLLPEKILINNTILKEEISKKAMPKIEFHKVSIKINSTDSIDLETKIMLPVSLNKMHVTQYPLLLNVYGGPSSQAVTTKFSVDWSTYLVSSLNIINLYVDARGTINRGRQFERAIYKNMGKVEIHDQIKATEKIASKFHFINKTQVGAYGWSYGGFAVGHILRSSENKIIRCGVSVAPVTSFDYYDTAYTERYLGLKEKNPLAYKQTDISNFARNFKSDMKKKYLIIHGTKDDNVHFLNSAKLIRALVAVDFDFDVMVYPDEAHSLSGGRTHFHVFRKITTFLMNCYNKTSVDNYIDLFQ